MTTGLSDKQLLAGFLAATKTAREGVGSYEARTAGLRAVADLAISQADSEIHGLRQELERVRVELTIAQRK